MLRVFVLALGLAPILAHAEEGGITPKLSSGVTLGWTSNAEGAPTGTSDTIIQHQHKIGFASLGGDYAMRGSLKLSETRYTRFWQENDRDIGLDFMGEWRVAPDTAARLNLSMAYMEEGQAMHLGADLIGGTTPIFKPGIGGEIETQYGNTLLIAGLNYGGVIHGDSWFSRLAAPQRIRADTGTISGDLRLIHPLNEALAVTGVARGIVQSMSSSDQALYGRIPVRALRLAAGVESKIPLRAAFSLEAGADIIWAGVDGIDVFTMPYARSDVTVALGAGFDLSASLRTSLDLETPADGYVDWKIDGRAAIGYAIAQTARLEAAIFASATRSVAFDIEHKSQLGGELSAEAGLGHGFTARAHVRHSINTRFGQEFEETRLGVTLAATI